MTQSLVQLAKSVITPDMLQRLGGQVNESPGQVERAMGGIIPALLGGIADFGSSPFGASKLMNMFSEGHYQDKLAAVASDTGGSISPSLMSAGTSILSTIFGNKLGSVTDAVTRSTGVKESSISSLLSMAAPLVMGVLGREVQTRGLGASSLASMLMGERESVAKLLPAGLGNVFGWAKPLAGGAQAVGVYTDPEVVAPKRSSALMWVVPLLLIAGLLALFSWLRRPADETRARLAAISLPGGLSLHAAENSMNYSLARYLGSSDTEIPKRFVFDSMNFGVASAQPTDESRQTITDLATILKAYPSARVRLEGHTDNTGDAAANKELSDQRAQSIKSLLVQSGVDGSRIETAGYGSERPIASNETEEGKLRNRRTELVVIQKS